MTIAQSQIYHHDNEAFRSPTMIKQKTQYMANLELALQLNNKGVAHRRSGDERSAIEVLTKSLTMVKTLLSDDAVPSDANQLPTTSFAFCRPDIFHSTVPLTSISDDSSFIYSNAITFSPSIMLHCASGQADHRLLSATIIFNLALIHHLRGSEICLTKAEKMYDMVLQLLLDVPFSSSGTSTLLQLAATNNWCLILHRRGKLDQAKQGLETLESIIYSLEETSRFLFQADEWDCLMGNILLLIPPSAAPAA